MGIINFKQHFSDREIITSIKNGNSHRENLCLKQLYKENKIPITSYILKNSGNELDAKEILQHAIIILYEKIKNGDFKLSSKLSTYIFSIAKNLWFAELRKNKKVVAVDEHNYFEKITDTIEYEYELEQTNKQKLVFQLMNQLKNDCKEILVYTVYQKYTMNEVADIMGFKNDQTARNKKSKCLKYLKKLILESPQADTLVPKLTNTEL